VVQAQIEKLESSAGAFANERSVSAMTVGEDQGIEMSQAGEHQSDARA
jgi:hypothetical protein